MIKVGLLISDPFHGGISSYCINLCKALRGKIEFHIITAGLDGHDTGKRDFNAYGEENIHTISSSRNDPSLSILHYQYSLVNKLPSIIRDNRLDLIHSAGPLADQFSRLIGIASPYLLTYHTTLWGQRNAILTSGVHFNDLDPSEKLTLFLYAPLKLYESLSLARASTIIAVSNSVKNDLMAHYKYEGEIHVIPNGIDTEAFKPDKIPRENKYRTVIFSGRLIAHKGPQVVINAIPQVLQQNEDIAFIFAGAGKSYPYEMALKDMGIPEKNFKFCHLTYEDMPEFYRCGGILVLPSLLESFPMAILEAMASGLPVVASDVGDVAELVKNGETGFLIQAGDYRSLALRINELLDDEQLQKKMGDSARNFIKSTYSLETMGQRTLDVYKKVLESET